MKKILVTGSMGYIGSVLTEYLSERGFDVVGMDTAFFEKSILYNPAPSNNILFDARMLTESDLLGVDCVVHLAGISNDPIGALQAEKVYDPTRAYSIQIAKLCKKMNIKFIFASSCSVYGVGDGQFLSEEATCRPQSLYSLNKVQIEEDLREISDQNFSPIALRFATIYGPSPRIRFDVVVNMLVGMAVSKNHIVLNSNGLSWRPNLHILDACKAIWCAINLKHSGSDLLVMNVGSDIDNVQIIDIAKMVQSVNPKSTIEFLSNNPKLDSGGLIVDRKIKGGGDTRTYKVSFEKIKACMPEFNCDWNLSSGIADLTSKLQKLPLVSELFDSRGFYRLQRLEDLYRDGFLSDELLWVNGRP